MDRFLFLTVDGLARGAVFAAFALALVLIWRGTRVINFAQGAMAAATTYIAYSVTSATGSYWYGLIAAIAGGFVLGGLVERVLMRRLDTNRPLAAVIVALGVVMVLHAVLGMIYGNDFRPMQLPFSREPFRFGDVAVLSPYDLFVFITVGIVVLALAYLFTRTDTGLKMRASAFAPDVSRLLGVKVSAMLTLGWALAGAVGALAALLVVPTELGLNPHAVDLVFIFAFTAAVIGGLDSPVGAVIGGLVTGLLLGYVSGYLSGSIAPLAVLLALLGVLLIRPQGIFSGTATRQV
ncbi:branched-chain amino acid ABC transporter permease [Rhodococcus sp. HNM0563]|uniref:branched-chain amino acid ABC transporter permease n=1 Tax=unclassified Rhodococcus (in: high G+C Gram-positive bacteria) TaxID=192944 RepID=UPI00146CCFB4|nr:MULTISPECIES: branched-chain amino acid ABC transporter permease [unclassified Rhodococcus (in: high G+C Gram-positive bacteria)]MCK0092342.1 branched-chain amino acid ABC transporter permease [Rhodococcus sp. F64268]NLU63088.1 branched-chain amino acid ABC transporter permease [Rhodococcus sp. HNM0563]